MNNKKGFTLIELIVTMAIGLITLVTAYNILFVGVKGHSSSLKGFENQSEVRYSIETINNAIKFSTVGFAVTTDDFKPTIKNGKLEGLVKPWNYIGLGPDNKSIVHYKYEGTDDKTGSYKIETLANGLGNLSYELKFSKPEISQEDKLVKYTLKNKSNNGEEHIETELEAMNALHIVDWGDKKNPSIALAYRTEETPEINKKPVAAISMVLDTSGSMNWDMDGKEIKRKNNNPSRLSLLKSTLTDSSEGLFSIFKDSDVYISLVPFSFTANIPNKNYNLNNIRDVNLSKFYNVKNEKTILKKVVNALNANGATNTGDGMRRAYYQLEKFNDEKNSKYNLKANENIKNYIIILVDGVTTAGSANIKVSTYTKNRVWRGKYQDFITDNGDNIGEAFYTTNNSLSGNYNRLYNGNYETRNNPIPRPIGDGANIDDVYGEPYVKKIGEMIKKTKIIDQAFVIGYSNKESELESLTNIAESLEIDVKDKEASEKFKNNKFVFIATDKVSLNKAFQNIGGYINEELWQVEGPRLKP